MPHARHDEQAAAVAHAYNQEGDPVNATAAKYRHQDTPAQLLARAIVDTSPHLGAKNIEVFGNSVSKNSPKLSSSESTIPSTISAAPARRMGPVNGC